MSEILYLVRIVSDGVPGTWSVVQEPSYKKCLNGVYDSDFAYEAVRARIIGERDEYVEGVNAGREETVNEVLELLLDAQNDIGDLSYKKLVDEVVKLRQILLADPKAHEAEVLEAERRKERDSVFARVVESLENVFDTEDVTLVEDSSIHQRVLDWDYTHQQREFAEEMLNNFGTRPSSSVMGEWTAVRDIVDWALESLKSVDAEKPDAPEGVEEESAAEKLDREVLLVLNQATRTWREELARDSEDAGEEFDDTSRFLGIPSVTMVKVSNALDQHFGIELPGYLDASSVYELQNQVFDAVILKEVREGTALNAESLLTSYIILEVNAHPHTGEWAAAYDSELNLLVTNSDNLGSFVDTMARSIERDLGITIDGAAYWTRVRDIVESAVRGIELREGGDELGFDDEGDEDKVDEDEDGEKLIGAWDGDEDDGDGGEADEDEEDQLTASQTAATEAVISSILEGRPELIKTLDRNTRLKSIYYDAEVLLSELVHTTHDKMNLANLWPSRGLDHYRKAQTIGDLADIFAEEADSAF